MNASWYQADTGCTDRESTCAPCFDAEQAPNPYASNRTRLPQAGLSVGEASSLVLVKQPGQRF